MGDFEIIVKWKIVKSLKVVIKGENMSKVWGQELNPIMQPLNYVDRFL